MISLNKDPFTLFNNNLNLVYSIVKKYDYGYVEKDDLLQSGFMGLFKASLKFDEGYGYKFSTLASKYIEGEIKKEITNNTLIRLPNKTYKILKMMEDHKTEEEIKNRLHISSKMIKEAIAFKALTIFDETTFMKDDTFKDMLLDLNELERKVIILKYRHNLSQKDIGRLLNLGQPTISKIIKSSLKKMK